MAPLRCAPILSDVAESNLTCRYLADNGGMSKAQVRALLILASGVIGVLTAFGVVPPDYLVEAIGSIGLLVGGAIPTPGKAEK